MSEFIKREQAESDLLACAAFVAERIRSADGHAASVSDIAVRYAEKGDLDLAASLADTIDDPHSRDSALSEIVWRCADFNDDEYGLQLIDAIEDSGFQQQARHALALAQIRNHRVSDALKTIQALSDANAALAEIAVYSAHNGDETQAHQLLKQVDLPVVRVQTLNELARVKIKQNQSLESVLDEALKEIQNVDFAEERTQLLLDIATRFIEAHDTERASEVLEKARLLAESLERSFRDYAFAQIAFLSVETKDYNRSETLLKSIIDAQQSAAARAAIALEHFNENESELALSNLEEAYAVLRAQAAREVRDSAAKFDLLRLIAVRFAQFNKFERAYEIALENPDEDLRARALTEIAGVYAAQGNFVLAEQAANVIKDQSARVFALISTANAEIKQNNVENAARTLEEAHSLIEEIGQLSFRSQALNKLAESYSALEDEFKVHQILHESLTTAAAILDHSQQCIVLADLAETFERLSVDYSAADFEIMRLIVRKNL